MDLMVVPALSPRRVWYTRGMWNIWDYIGVMILISLFDAKATLSGMIK